MYIGKAINLRTRIKSYFSRTASLGIKTQRLVRTINGLDYIKVNTEIEALLLESRLIKKFKPPYNISLKDDSSPYFIHITREIWPKPIINHSPQGSVAGPFLNLHIPKKILRIFRHISPYCTSTRPVKKPCLYSHIKLCTYCPGYGIPSYRPSYLKNIRNLKNLLKGKFSVVKTSLTSEMKNHSKKQEYEKADIIKQNLLSLEHIRIRPILPEEYILNPNLVDDVRQNRITALMSCLKGYLLFSEEKIDLHRIEMYDVAHLSGTSATASMTVAVDGEVNPKYYRHFKIKSAKSDSDVDMMLEVLSRRFGRNDWPIPDLIVLDGGKGQLSIIDRLEVAVGKLPPVIGLAKHNETLIIPTKDGFDEIALPKDHQGLLLLIHLRDEAHRFSRRLHHKYRSRSFLT